LRVDLTREIEFERAQSWEQGINIRGEVEVDQSVTSRLVRVYFNTRPKTTLRLETPEN